MYNFYTKIFYSEKNVKNIFLTSKVADKILDVFCFCFISAFPREKGC